MEFFVWDEEEIILLIIANIFEISQKIKYLEVVPSFFFFIIPMLISSANNIIYFIIDKLKSIDIASPLNILIKYSMNYLL